MHRARCQGSVLDSFTQLFARSGFLPHGYCFTWSPGLLWSMVTANAVIALSYFSIPLAISTFLRKRTDFTHRGTALLFCCFIAACGMTHVMNIWTIWQPDYAVETAVKVVTAVVSLVTAIGLWPLIPKALRIPSVSQLQAAVASLEAEVRKRKTAEEHLLDTEQSLSVALSSIGAGFVSTDAWGRITRMNAVAERMSGWPQDLARGRPINEVLQPHASCLAEAEAWFRQLARNQSDGAVHRLTLVDREGRPTQAEVQGTATRTEEGRLLGMTLLIRDMTALRNAETELDRLAAIVESSDDAIISKTLDGHITSWNRGAQELFGYTADEAIGQSALILIPPERADEEMHILASLANGQKVPHFDTVRRTKDGRLIDVSVTISPIHDAQGNVVGGSKIARNITEQRQAEASRRKAERLEEENRQMVEANRIKNQFLANMSHELRTPLNAIIGFADLLHAGAVPTESPKHKEFVGHIADSGRHLLQLINDVLDLSKVEAGKFEFAPEAMDLERVVKDVVNTMRTMIERKSLTVQIDIDATLKGIELDPARFKQVLYNYQSNAVKFTPDGGRIHARAMAEGSDRFRLEVEDSGIGIAAADIPRLFVEFQQLDASLTKKYQGTGLGLALTRRLVEAQGGTVGVRSEVGVGSVFHLVLPRVHRVAAADAAAPITPAAQGA